MSRIRAPHLLAVLLGGMGVALCLGAPGPVAALTAGFAAVSLTDLGLGALGLVIAAITAIAGTLIVADARADAASLRAWQDANVELVEFVTPIGPALLDRGDARYAAAPQDEDLRTILLAHRFDSPVAPAGKAKLPAAARGGSCRGERPAVGSTGAELPINHVRAPAGKLADQSSKPTAFGQLLRLHVKMTKDIRGGGIPILKRVANAGAWLDWTIHAACEQSRPPAAGQLADVIVLADRKSSEHRIARHVAAKPASTVQPACRGPPAAANQRRARARPGANAPQPIRSCRENQRSQSDAPCDYAVTDDLGFPVPVCDTELEVLEAHLGEPLAELLSKSGPDRIG